jgi:hypothetical protein
LNSFQLELLERSLSANHGRIFYLHYDYWLTLTALFALILYLFALTFRSHDHDHGTCPITLLSFILSPLSFRVSVILFKNHYHVSALEPLNIEQLSGLNGWNRFERRCARSRLCRLAGNPVVYQMRVILI